MGGLSKRVRDWYLEQILRVLSKRKRLTTKEIVLELRKIPQRKYPITTQRIVAFLKELRYLKKVKYHSGKKLVGEWSKT